MELLGENAIKSIANLCGVDLSQHDRDRTEEEHDDTFEKPGTQTESHNSDQTNYIIRRGNESDVLKDIRR